MTDKAQEDTRLPEVLPEVTCQEDEVKTVSAGAIHINRSQTQLSQTLNTGDKIVRNLLLHICVQVFFKVLSSNIDLSCGNQLNQLESVLAGAKSYQSITEHVHTHTCFCPVGGNTLKFFNPSTPQHHCMASWGCGVCVFLSPLFVFTFSTEFCFSVLSLSRVMMMITAR